MSDLDSRLDELVPAGAPPSIADLDARAARRRSRRHRRMGALGALALIAGGIVTWQITDDEPTITQVVTTEPTTPPTTIAADAPIRVPIIEHEWCEHTTPAHSGDEDSKGYGIEPRIYAEPTAPLAVQIIGRSDELPDRYTVVLRVPDDGTFQTRSWGASVEPTGVGHARTVLDDGTALYFRSRGVGQEELQELVSTVTPRTLASPFPGVDVTNLAASQILAQEDRLSAVVAMSTTCQHDYGSSGGPAEVYVSVWDGPMASVLAGALDAPPPIQMRIQSDGTLLHMWGGPLRSPEQSGATMTLDDVVDASSP